MASRSPRVPWRRGGVATPFGVPQVLTIKDWEVVEFKDQKTDILQKKLALIVDDDQKLLLNKENTRTLIEMFGTQETDDWVGREIEVYYEPNVTFGGKRVGGVRVRPPRGEDQNSVFDPAHSRNAGVIT